MLELEATVRRILRKAHLMQLDSTSPEVRSDAAEIAKLAQIALRQMENLEDAVGTTTGGSRTEN